MVARLITSFYSPSSLIDEGIIRLPDEEARHAVNVLRMQAGESIEVVDGEGGWYRAQIAIATRNIVTARILDQKRDIGESPYDLTLGFPILKQTSRMEFVIEKGVELGINRFVPVLTERTVGKTLRRERLVRIAIAAMKQSGRSRLPVIEAATPLEEILEEWSSDYGALRLICHEKCRHEQNVVADLLFEKTIARACAFVGPEGGFSEDEVRKAEQRGFGKVSLGRRRLRSDTACIVIASQLMGHLEK